MKGISYYEMWLKTFEKNGKEPEQLDEAYHRPYIVNLFEVARLYGKIFVLDPKLMCQNLDKSLQLYKRVVQKTELYKVTTMGEEVKLAKDMVQLLPVQINKINTTQSVGL